MYRASYRCFVDGLQEVLYFKHLETLLKQGREKVVVFPTTVNNYDNLSTSYASYDVACVFDNDLDVERFEKIMQLCYLHDRNAQRLSKADKHHVFPAYSNICFDLWLVLHKMDCFGYMNSTDAYVPYVRKAYGLPKNADIKEKRNIEKIVSQITLDDVKLAILRAKRIRSQKLNSDKKNIDKTNYYYYDNPDFSIDLFLSRVIEDFESH